MIIENYYTRFCNVGTRMLLILSLRILGSGHDSSIRQAHCACRHGVNSEASHKDSLQSSESDI